MGDASGDTQFGVEIGFFVLCTTEICLFPRPPVGGEILPRAKGGLRNGIFTRLETYLIGKYYLQERIYQNFNRNDEKLEKTYLCLLPGEH